MHEQFVTSILNLKSENELRTLMVQFIFINKNESNKFQFHVMEFQHAAVESEVL